MSQFISGSPEGDDNLPSFMEQRNKLSASSSQTNRNPSADPSSSTPQRNSTLSPPPTHSGHHHHHHHSHSHSHGHTHNYAHGHGSCNSPSQNRSGTMRTMSNTSNSSLGVPGGSQAHSPSRSMTRSPSHEYRETLDAKSKNMDDGSLVINQYKITDTIGRGAYGTVRKALLIEDPDVKFAVKEFGKTRLRKTHRADKLRKPARNRGPRAPTNAGGDNAGNRSDPTKGGERHEQQDDTKDPLTLIRHEIAILKKLHHPHVVKLYEVLDDPTKDNLYMVFEYCPDGTVIDIKLNSQVEPLPEDVARLYFVQILMGIEYLHENEVVHRDIKPDNILLSDDRKTCKMVDFGVSEMFLKPGDDTMQKSAGSPAFMSPELCTAGHAEYHGKADDIWSFGVTLYCMVVGHLPFDRDNFYQMYEAIKNDEPEYPDHLSDDLRDLLKRMLTKDPQKRITVDEMREHPWTLSVEDGVLLSKEDNLEAVISEITDEDLDCAICKITNIFTFARAIHRFKKGGSMQRARRGTSQTSDGSSNNDSSWFPRSNDSPDKLSRSGSKDGASDDASKGLASAVSTIKEESPAPASQEKERKGGKGDTDTRDTQQETRELQAAAARMFESPQMHTFELPPEEPDGNGPLKRNHSGPISTLHKPDAEHQAKGPPIITTDSPRSASPDMVASPTSDGGFDVAQEDMSEPNRQTTTQSQDTSSDQSSRSTDYSPDTSKPDEAVATHLSNLMLQHDSNGHNQDDTQQRKEEVLPPKKNDNEDWGKGEDRAKSVQERAASLGKKSTSKPKPKLLPDQPTVLSPRTEDLKTPPGAAEVYMLHKHSDSGEKDGEGEGGRKEDYFKVPGESQHEDNDGDDERKGTSEAEKQAQTV